MSVGAARLDLSLPDSSVVVVFRALQLGDMLCAVPALRALRNGLPGARIVLVGLPWATQFAQRFAALVDEFVAFPGHPELPEPMGDPRGWESFLQCIRARHADLAIQLHGSGEISNRLVREFGARRTVGFTQHAATDGGDFFSYPPHGHESDRLLALMRALGMVVHDRHLVFPLHAADADALQVSGVLARLDGRPYVFIHAGARCTQRRWPVEAFAAVADGIAEVFGWQVVLTGSGEEQGLVQQLAQAMRHDAVNAALHWPIGAMAALMEGARLLVCNDSGASHLAAALRLPSVVVFRRDERERWAPQDHRLHRCVLDSEGTQVAAVIAAARQLMDRQPRRQARMMRRPSARG